MTDKEIMLGIKYCHDKEAGCDYCPYAIYLAKDCDTNLMKDTIDLINRQQAENEMLKRKLAMAKEGLKHTCITCFYMETPSQEVPCRDCRSFNKWKWRGDEDDSE